MKTSAIAAPSSSKHEAAAVRARGRPVVVPRSTYRLQFHKDFTFQQAAALADYFDRLGVGGIYASPVATARPGSVHGYDVIRHDAINPELGSDEDFEAFARSLSDRQIALIMDVVPNHMCIAGSDNPWWNDVLENGPSSPYAKYFDILWNPPKRDLENKVLLPFLGAQYGRMLESQEIRLAFEGGRFFCHYYSSKLPVAPRTWSLILEPVLARMKPMLGENHAATMELESVLTALNHLPLRTETDPERIKIRYREKEIARRRIAALAESSAEFRDALSRTIEELNGKDGDPRTFDRLETILDDQTYRLCFWRVAADEINYRRFFDISDLAAIRVEEPEVFEAVHSLPLRMISRGWVSGLRIDHVDGLFDPTGYLADLQAKCLAALETARSSGKSMIERFFADRKPSEFFVAVEKILVGDERLRADWAASGTTGYDFMNDVNGLFVNTGAKRRFVELYSRFTGRNMPFPEVLATCKKFIMLVGLASELQVLATLLDRISEQHRWSRDFTKESLRFALREVIAYFPVYRSYVRAEDREVGEADRRVILSAVREARRHNPATDRSIFEFIQSVLLLEHPDGLSADQIRDRKGFVLRFQQLTSPVMAKGMEDTAFYRYFPLASINEVGGDPDRFGVTVRDFHAKNRERRELWPHAMLATATHDTKRGEDARARINVLSEIPVKFYREVRRWEAANRSKKTEVDGRLAPDANEEYLLYQTLIGTWPVEPMDDEAHAAYVGRIEAYFLKAIKEAKQHTSWISPNEAYEKAASGFVRGILDRSADNRFPGDIQEFIKGILIPGLYNGLSQTLIKIASPGIPDFYQGTDLWDFSLVDPDNRRPVDYELRKRLLERLDAGSADDAARCADLARRLPDGTAKLYVVKRGLDLRRREEKLFIDGAYAGLGADGPRRNNVVAFERSLGGKSVIAAAGRFLLDLSLDDNNRVTSESWSDTVLVLKGGNGAARYRDVFSGAVLATAARDGKTVLPLADLFRFLPVALLEKIS